MSYNAHMPKRVGGEKKTEQIGFRITPSQKERLDKVIARIQAINRRVIATEIYEELMSLSPPEFVTESDRLFLLGSIDDREWRVPSRPTERPKVRGGYE